jgi:thiol:disulfide interchange protein
MEKKQIFLLTLLLISAFTGVAQILQPVKWNFDSKKISDTETELMFKANMDKGWHIYALSVPKDGPIPTSFKFEPSDKFELVGKMKSPKPIEEYDKVIQMELQYYAEQVVFTQVVRVKTQELVTVKGELEFMACNDRSCLPPDNVSFTFDIKAASPGQPLKEPGSNKTSEGPVSPSASSSPGSQQIVQADTQKTVEYTTSGAIEPQSPEKPKSSGSLWTFFFIALGVGFVGLLTPCVYPMIPMTISFFMNASQNKLKAKTQALVFGISIIFIYTFVGVLVSVIFGAETIKQVSDHWITNLFFFLLFAIFAASFFGMFEIVLPTSLTNKSDRQADKGGYVGAFFMALTLVLVSFSCTAPFVGGILVEAATGEVIKPIVGMFGFSLAFGVVFTLLAIFPSWLGKMPKSGGWLNSVKVVLAFVILAIGMKYLLVPNQALGWGITREVYIGIWMVLFSLMGLYLLGKIRFAHDSPVDHISVPRLIFVVISFSFVLYLLPGLFGAPLKAVSGYLPAESGWDLNEIIRESTRNITSSSPGNNIRSELCDEPKYSNLFTLPNGLQGYFDYEQGMACARKLNKPVFLDIKGHACTNCKVIEKNVWSDPEVLRRLRDNFIIIALYVDDNTELPQNEWITSSFDGKLKKTIGRKNMDFQITRYGVNAQPYYVLLDLNGEKLTDPIAFELNVKKYADFLDKGIAEFKKRHP